MEFLTLLLKTVLKPIPLVHLVFVFTTGMM